METCYLFDSIHYQAVSWKKIFETAGAAITKNKQPTGLVNSHGVVILTDSLFLFERTELCFENDSSEVDVNTLQLISMPLLENSDLYLFKLVIEKSDHSAVSKKYIYFLTHTIKNLYQYTQTIFLYTHEHLSKRKYGNIPISQIEIVQCDFTDIIIAFKKIESSINTIVTVDDIIYLINILLEVLIHLSKLSGARAVLKNNVIDLIFHVQFFKKYLKADI